MAEKLSVWLDADLCSGCGCCVSIAPEIFEHIEGIAYVKEGGVVLDSCSVAIVPSDHQEATIEAAEQCPGEIIHIINTKQS